jgi:HEPN domain-containing protein
MGANLPRQWLDKAAEDLVVARLVLAENHTPHACFLSQQCVEKSLKAFLIFRTNDHPRTHKLVDLLGECQKLDPSFGAFLDDCIIIDQYYIPTRYPDAIPGTASEGVPSSAESQEAIELAEKIHQFVKRNISA